MSACNVCGNEVGNTTHIARELHLGMGDEFKYLECSSCGCLQIVEVPKDLSKYYPSYYYSYKSGGSSLEFSRRGLGGYKQRFVLRTLTNYYFGKKSFFGKWLASSSSLAGDFPLWVRQQRLNLGLRQSSPILDVGCGKGKTLLDMRAYGFTNLQGIDPFLDSDVFYENGVRIYKKGVEDLEGKFDLIMLNHSFEHMPDQLATLVKLRSLLSPNGYLLIRVPIVGSYQWQRYGLNWVGLDAPRHLYLHSLRSMNLLVNQAGLCLDEVVFDSDAFTLWGSEQYEAGISLIDSRSYWVNPSASIFKATDIERFVVHVAELNANGTGDCAAFYLRSKPSQVSS